MQNDIRLGQIFGIEIFISYSWFFIFALVAITLSFGFFPREFPEHSPFVNVGIGLASSALFFGSLLFHELSHAYVGNLNHIPIKKITLFIFGGMSQMSHEPEDPGSELKMAIAGPASSVFLSIFFYAIYLGMTSVGLPSLFYAAFGWLAEINVFLAIFNLVPGFPLDGGRVLRATIWSLTGNLERATKIASRSGQGIAFIMMSFGLLMFLLGQVGGVWLILIGWFLYQSAVASYKQITLQQSLSSVQVESIMSADLETVSPDISLEELVNHYFLRHRFGRFPVVDEGSLLGVVTLHDIKEIPRDQWSTRKAGEIVEPIDEEMFVRPDDLSVVALKKMAENNIGHLLVVDERGSLAGIVTRTDIFSLVRVRSELNI